MFEAPPIAFDIGFSISQDGNRWLLLIRVVFCAGVREGEADGPVGVRSGDDVFFGYLEGMMSHLSSTRVLENTKDLLPGL